MEQVHDQTGEKLSHHKSECIQLQEEEIKKSGVYREVGGNDQVTEVKLVGICNSCKKRLRLQTFK